jgi:NAD(P)-dependent dehydrogenase (short-subunit alcohol dehydrogenase family)
MATRTRPVSGRVAAITGGARGIGKATAAALVKEGARVAIGDLDLDLARTTAEELGGGVRAYELDVTSRPSMARFLDAVESDLGPLDVLVNNAGIMPIGPIVSEDDATAVRLLDINVHGVIFGTKEALARMVPRGSGHLVNMASVAGKAGFPHLATYCASKHAVVGFSEAVRSELRGTGVEVTCVMPALVNTELTSGLKAGRGVEKTEPEDVAAAIVDALRTPRFEVYVPRVVGRIARVLEVLPRRAAEAIGRVLDSDKVMVQADMAGRAAYEQRVARSEPSGLEPSRSADGDPQAPAAEREPVG